ncbi:MAG: RNA polymerase sigma factor [Actinomycetota bacterium]|nr:RNA polymerase sigma factor [Actinomycetota bacterium]
MRDVDFEQLVRRHAQEVYGYLLYRTGNHHLAEELVGDTLERAYRSRGRYDGRRASEKTWLLTIALNRWRDLMRRESTERAALERIGEGLISHVDDMSTAEDRRALLDGLAALPEDEREVVALSYGADLTAKQIAQVLELPVTTVQGRLYRGLRKLRDELG